MSSGSNRRKSVNRYLVELRTEGKGAAARSTAVGVGAFIGCLPVYGLHLAACLVVAKVLGLNRVLTYLAANISNPFMAPILTFAEVQIGRFVRTGGAYALTATQLQALDLRTMAGDLAIGSLIVGALIGALGASVTYLAIGGKTEDDGFAAAAASAADRYIEDGLWTWEFANQKLQRDPIYRHMLTDASLPGRGAIIDFGCGLGLAIVLLRVAAELDRHGNWPTGVKPPPRFNQIIGVDPRSSVAAIAARALGEPGAIVNADGRHFQWPSCDAVLFFDVLHLLPFDDQLSVLSAARRSLGNEGVIIVREADASAGWSFHLVRIGNHLRALAGGRWRPRFYFRTADEWRAVFLHAGFVATVQRPAPAFRANVAFRLVLTEQSGQI